MSYVTGVTRGGESWVPEFIADLNQATCIGCGRCFKVCPRDVFELVEREDDSAEDFSDDTSMVMAISNALDCIGCQACARVCPKKCHSHSPANLVA